MIDRIKQLLQQKNATFVAHYYVDGALQDLAEQTGGFVGDSLEMARFGKNTDADIIIVAGVKFMGQTAKILAPHKKVLVLDENATCSLDEGCNSFEFAQLCNKHKDREVVVYANTSAEIKAIADWVVTSSSAVNVVNSLKEQGKKILWAPDKHLGNYVLEQTGADMLLWDGSCVVHENFKADALQELQKIHPQAEVLVHPESPKEIIALADVVGSTTMLIDALKNSSANEFIVATDNGIFHKMKQARPDAKILEAPNAGVGASCESCAHCEWMEMNNLEKLLSALEREQFEIHIEESTIKKAELSINKLLNFTEKN